MQRLPEFQAIVKQFPWGRLESDGTFNRDIARGRYDVLGSSGMGFWSHKGGPVPHQAPGPEGQHNAALDAYPEPIKRMMRSFYHLDGKDLLQKKHLTDEDGWKLPAALIPYREFSDTSKRPMNVNDFGESVKDWDSWYRWRKLPKESIAALIMNFPLSVYQLLVYCLEVTNSAKGSKEHRVPIHIHLLGTEAELNYIPMSVMAYFLS
jgi:hypothetical protein